MMKRRARASLMPSPISNIIQNITPKNSLDKEVIIKEKIPKKTLLQVVILLLRWVSLKVSS